MSQDDWNNPNRNKPPGDDQRLPGPGESWADFDEPKPLHQVRDDEWGTPNNLNAPQQQQQQYPQQQPPYGPPMNRGAGPQGYDGSAGPGAQLGTGGRRKPGSADLGGWDQPGPGGYQDPYQAPYQDPYGPPQGGPMMHHPGYQMQRPPSTMLDGNDVLAIVLSGFFPGVGHMMLGQTVKGAVILATMILTCGMGYVVAMLICVDAYYVARARKFRPVGEWEFLPQ